MKKIQLIILIIASLSPLFAFPNDEMIKSAADNLGIPYDDVWEFTYEYYGTRSTETDLFAIDILNEMAKSGLPLSDIVAYTEETDPNNMIGKPEGYSSKADARDERLLTTDPTITVEVFPTHEDAESRKKYVDSVAEIFSFAKEYSYVVGPALLRLDSAFSATQAEEYHVVFLSVLNGK